MEQHLISALNKRYATKKFDPTKKISNEKLEAIIEAVRLTPTSYGLQLMKIVVVENEAVRKELIPHSYGQTQVLEASHLIVLCREKEIDESHISAYISNIAETRNTLETDLRAFKDMMKSSILGMTKESRDIWMDNQVYISLGNMLTACAMLDIDACPMEGFIAEEYNRTLNLAENNLCAVLAIPIGYRSEDDAYAHVKKVRRAKKDFVVKI